MYVVELPLNRTMVSYHAHCSQHRTSSLLLMFGIHKLQKKAGRCYDRTPPVCDAAFHDPAKPLEGDRDYHVTFKPPLSPALPGGDQNSACVTRCQLYLHHQDEKPYSNCIRPPPNRTANFCELPTPLLSNRLTQQYRQQEQRKAHEKSSSCDFNQQPLSVSVPVKRKVKSEPTPSSDDNFVSQEISRCLTSFDNDGSLSSVSDVQLLSCQGVNPQSPINQTKTRK